MGKYKMSERFTINKDVQIFSRVAKKGSQIEIIEIDEMDNELPYKVYFEDEGVNEWIYMSEDEIKSII